ncbi:hypothetical protein [Massilia sp. YMA4]|uniref:hypothetical protein n=1 Tax=Massilia sp. YMA4 TaxID=1593482 RepID=UPI00158357CF|nr:hypothetical protein [Massilia sp. YMA4]
MQKGPPAWVALLAFLVPLTGIELVTFALRMRSFQHSSGFIDVDLEVYFSYFSTSYLISLDPLR